MTQHKQIGPPVMIGDYRVRVVSDSEHPHYLSKATWEDPKLRSPGAVIYEGGTPKVPTILVTENGVEITGPQTQVQWIPSDALEAVLKVAGWKVERPR